MAKAYDRVSRSFTCIMLRRMEFCERIIDMIWRTMSNNWHSVMVNGTRWGFFQSTRGLKQGDPLAPSLFIIGAELLYEESSGHKINKDKSHFMTSSGAFQSAIRRIKAETGFSGREYPLTYLGCPLYIGRKRIIHYNNLTTKIVGRIKGWHGKMLSYGGRATLIKHMLQSILIHLLSVVSPPKTVMKHIEKLAANFLWGLEKDKLKYHWASWKKLAYPE
uniref:Reverse transcriptase domain-containing protein n=1 Tax=Nicotiana tabacum TaxID=4097 RepID=A0A1S4B3B7_TOBAC|nr:PREDICTED: uncharacterized protein LOC107804102 [Nicotiana tabacum]